MKALLRETFLLLAIACALIHGRITSSNAAPSAVPADSNKVSPDLNQPSDYQYEDYYDDERDEVLFSEDKPCPRDCICQTSVSSRIARCNRLEVGTQKFGDDVTGIVVQNVDQKHPLVLTDMMFRKLGLHQITTVQIMDSVIASISPTAFKGLHELYNVNLTGNGIEKIDSNIFAYNEKLSLVDLSNNPFIIDPKSDAPFINSSSVQELELSRCGIENISNKALSKLPNLMYINLSGNKIKELPADVFSNLRILEEVDLGDNLIEDLPEGLFSNNSEMTTLRLRGNPITSVIGLNIDELLTIDISLAKISTVGPSMFSGIPLVSNLNLSGNGISKIHNLAFHDLTMLNYLDLSNNNLDLVSDQLIKENVQLDIFKIAKNPFLKNLPEEGFVCSSEQFNIYLFDASGCSLEKISNNTFKTMPALSQLFLSHNNIKTIGSALQKMIRLIEIDLSYNSLTVLDNNAFSMNKDLGKLNLAGNPLTTLSSELFVNNVILTWLDVSSCRLNSLWDKRELHTGKILENLHFINISNNNIKSIRTNELEPINKLFTLDISQNPLECTLDFQTLMSWLGEHNVSPAVVDQQSAKLKLGEKNVGVLQKWEFLAKAVCGPSKILPVSQEEDVLIEQTKVEEILTKIENTKVVNLDNNYDLEDDEEYDYDEGTFHGDMSNVLPDEQSKSKENKNDNTLDIAVVNDIMKESKKTQKFLVDLEADKMLDELEDEKMEEEWVATFVERNNDNYYKQYLFSFSITMLCVLIIIFIMVKFIRHYLNRNSDKGFRCAVISSQVRVKKDCGLVYQQLSEDLTGPKTPIISRQILGGPLSSKLTDISYQSSPFHHSNVTPEHV